MDDDLDQLLAGLKLRRIREVLDDHLERAEQEGPSYADFLRRLLRAELQAQQMRFLGYRIKRAKLPEDWALESFPWARQPGVQRAAIEQLARLDFMDRVGNIVFVGSTGVAAPEATAPERAAGRRVPRGRRELEEPKRSDENHPHIG